MFWQKPVLHAPERRLIGQNILAFYWTRQGNQHLSLWCNLNLPQNNFQKYILQVKSQRNSWKNKPSYRFTFDSHFKVSSPCLFLFKVLRTERITTSKVLKTNSMVFYQYFILKTADLLSHGNNHKCSRSFHNSPTILIHIIKYWQHISYRYQWDIYLGQRT